MQHNLPDVLGRARRIRKNLLRMGAEKNLFGSCGLASLILAVSIDDITTLRMGKSHAWNKINGHIVDITATQFNGDWHADGEVIKGVLVTRLPRFYHAVTCLRGRRAYRDLLKWADSYSNYKYWDRLVNYWK